MLILNFVSCWSFICNTFVISDIWNVTNESPEVWIVTGISIECEYDRC
jgi:hypothetical protein